MFGKRINLNRLIETSKRGSFLYASKTVNFIRGPARSNLLTMRELVKLIAKEQQILPNWKRWPEALQFYQNLWKRGRVLWNDGKFSESIIKHASDLTWGQVKNISWISVELLAFYYIGLMIGKAIAFPLKILK